jgi:hypothetical protein
VVGVTWIVAVIAIALIASVAGFVLAWLTVE